MSKQELLRALIENTMDIVVSRDREGRALVFNHAFERVVELFFGVRPTPGFRTVDHLTGEARKRWEHRLEQVHAGEQIRWEFSWKLHGQVRHYEISLSPIYEKGEITGSTEFTRDITERVNMERTLRESEHRFRSFVENARDVVYSMSPEGRLTYVSPNWQTVMGEAPEEAIGRSYEDYIHPDDVADCRDYIARALNSEERESSVEYRARTSGGGWRWFVSTGSILCDETGKVVSLLGIAHDLTERKQLEDEVIARQREVADQNRLLERKNVALSELIAHSRLELEQLERRISSNIEQIILPILSELERSEGERKAEYLRLLDRSLKGLLSQGSSRFAAPELGLTPREIQVCEMIRRGLGSKEIARLLCIDRRGVESHRMNIRRKLGLAGSSTNLVTYLKSI